MAIEINDGGILIAQGYLRRVDGNPAAWKCYAQGVTAIEVPDPLSVHDVVVVLDSELSPVPSTVAVEADQGTVILTGSESPAIDAAVSAEQLDSRRIKFHASNAGVEGGGNIWFAVYRQRLPYIASVPSIAGG